jgi:hypothetical protein
MDIRDIGVLLFKLSEYGYLGPNWFGAPPDGLILALKGVSGATL